MAMADVMPSSLRDGNEVPHIHVHACIYPDQTCDVTSIHPRLFLAQPSINDSFYADCASPCPVHTLCFLLSNLHSLLLPTSLSRHWLAFNVAVTTDWRTRRSADAHGAEPRSSSGGPRTHEGGRTQTRKLRGTYQCNILRWVVTRHTTLYNTMPHKSAPYHTVPYHRFVSYSITWCCYH